MGQFISGITGNTRQLYIIISRNWSHQYLICIRIYRNKHIDVAAACCCNAAFRIDTADKDGKWCFCDIGLIAGYGFYFCLNLNIAQFTHIRGKGRELLCQRGIVGCVVNDCLNISIIQILNHHIRVVIIIISQTLPDFLGSLHNRLFHLIASADQLGAELIPCRILQCLGRIIVQHGKGNPVYLIIIAGNAEQSRICPNQIDIGEG